MKSSCIKHPENHKFIVIRDWQIVFCDGDKCAAALLSLFEYWHNIKIEQQKKAKEYNKMAQMHGHYSFQDDSLLQHHKTEDIEKMIMGLFKRDKIRASIKMLEEKKVIKVQRNPNPKFSFDNKRYFRFYPDILNNWISEEFHKIENKKELILKKKKRKSSAENRNTKENDSIVYKKTLEFIDKEREFMPLAENRKKEPFFPSSIAENRKTIEEDKFHKNLNLLINDNKKSLNEKCKKRLFLCYINKPLEKYLTEYPIKVISNALDILEEEIIRNNYKKEDNPGKFFNRKLEIAMAEYENNIKKEEKRNIEKIENKKLVEKYSDPAYKKLKEIVTSLPDLKDFNDEWVEEKFKYLKNGSKSFKEIEIEIREKLLSDRKENLIFNLISRERKKNNLNPTSHKYINWYQEVHNKLSNIELEKLEIMLEKDSKIEEFIS